MEKDYLWDKRGNDPAIQRLEESLKVFRTTETVLPQRILSAISVAPKSANSWSIFNVFKLSFATGAALASLLFIFAIFQIQKTSLVEVSSSVPAIEIQGQTPQSSFKNESLGSQNAVTRDIKTVSGRSRNVNGRMSRASYRTASRSSRSSRATRNPANKAGESDNKGIENGITDEEKAAYADLKMALTITSSKLKTVKDKVNGLGDSSALQKSDGK